MAIPRVPYLTVGSATGHPPISLTRPGISPGEATAEPELNAAESFGQLLTDAIRAINGVQQDADAQVNRLAAGEDVDLHSVMIAMENANLAFQLGLQARTKLLEAYQEIMRMPL